MLVSSSLFANYASKVGDETKELSDDEIKMLNKYFYLVVTLFIIEFILFVYAIVIAVQCNEGFFNTAVHIVLAMLFPLLYIIIMKVSGYCPARKGKSIRRR
jgi:hypothetical protein